MLRAFLANRSASTAVLFAMLLPAMVIAGGAAVDYSHVARAHTDLQAIVDSTALSLINPKYTQAEVQARAEALIRTQADAKFGYVGTLDIEARLQPDGRSVVVAVHANVHNRFMALVDMPTTPIAAGARAIRGLDGSVEVALVLDNTGSMSQSGKLPALKTAATSLIDTLTADPKADVRIGLVPFANYVNVGLGNRNAPWVSGANDYSVSKTNPPVCTKPQLDCAQTGTRQVCTQSQQTNCRMQSTTTYNDGVPTTTTRQVCDTLCVSYTSQSYCARWNYGPETCAPPTTSTTKYIWSGCVGSRAYPNNLTDDNAGLPYPAMMNTTCSAPLTPLTTNFASLKTQVNAMVATGETYIPAGLVWGLNMLSPSVPLSEGKAYDEVNRKPRKVLVFMTDGVNTKSLTTPSHDGSNRTEADTYSATLCETIKSRKIEVFSIALMVTDVAAKSMLQACATDAEHYFDATDTDALKAAFAKIAFSLQMPYLGQ
jgi:Flp pilus assembly protein TadG